MIQLFTYLILFVFVGFLSIFERNDSTDSLQKLPCEPFCDADATQDGLFFIHHIFYSS